MALGVELGFHSPSVGSNFSSRLPQVSSHLIAPYPLRSRTTSARGLQEKCVPGPVRIPVRGHPPPFAFLFFGGADVTHRRIHHRAPRRRKTKKRGGPKAGFKQEQFSPALSMARINSL